VGRDFAGMASASRLTPRVLRADFSR
jgi:hypothetical protein